MGDFMFIELHYAISMGAGLGRSEKYLLLSGGVEGTMDGFNNSDDNYVIVKETVEDIKAMFRYFANEGIMEVKKLSDKEYEALIEKMTK